MKKIRWFQCEDCTIKTERMVQDDELTVTCECSGVAKRLLSAPRVIGNTTGRSPSFSNRK